MAYSVRLPVFEGPLDLLLHLIQKAQIDIYDIPIALVTDQYMSYLSQMATLDLEVASEFVSLAATLLSIKVRMLLPRKEALQPGDSAVDPRVELVEALLEYGAFKHAADTLRDYEEDMARRFPRPALANESPVQRQEFGPIKATLYDLITAMTGMLRASIPAPPLEIRLPKYSFRTAFFRVLRALRRKRGERVSLREIIAGESDRAYVVTVFLAILELSRQGRLYVFQDGVFTDIFIQESEVKAVEQPA